MDHSPSSGPLEMICLCMVGKPKGQRGQVTCPYPHSPRPNGKRHLPQAVEISPLWQPELAALPGPRSRVCKLGCPRTAQHGAGKRAPPGRAVPTSLGAGLGQVSAWHPRPTGGSPRRRVSSAPERFHTSPPLGRQTSLPASFTFLGGLQQLSLLCPQPIILRGLPDAASQLRGPQRTLPSRRCCPLRARQPGLPARP